MNRQRLQTKDFLAKAEFHSSNLKKKGRTGLSRLYALRAIIKRLRWRGADLQPSTFSNYER